MKVIKRKELFVPVERRVTAYVVSFGYKEINDRQATWEEVTYGYRPTVEEIRQYITTFYNEQAQIAILKGMRYDRGFVWLSQENQQNYLTAYNMAFSTKAQATSQSTGEEDMRDSSPVIGTPFDYTIKLTDKDGQDFYHHFTTAESYLSFYRQVSDYINLQVTKAWKQKDAIDYSDYEE